MQILITSGEFAESGGPEWVIVELQGDLESKNPEQRMSNKEIGDLHFNKEGNPILIIGHHILHGKIAKFDKPFAVLEKNTQIDQDESTNKTVYKVKAIVRRKITFRERPKPIVSLHTSANNQNTLSNLSESESVVKVKVKVGANKKLDMDG